MLVLTQFALHKSFSSACSAEFVNPTMKTTIDATTNAAPSAASTSTSEHGACVTKSSTFLGTPLCLNQHTIFTS